MPKTETIQDAAKFIYPITMNGLNGRVLRLPGSKKAKREILLIYGQHASIERMYSFAEELSRYGNVTLPDLPGFGGMDSMYKIGEKPDLDTMADYLASFIKLRYRGKRLSILGVSYGFLVVTRMLQRYPRLAKKVDFVVSIAGFVHNEDFKFSTKLMTFYRLGTRFFSFRLPAWIVQNIFLQPPFVVAAYKLVEGRHVKLKDGDKTERMRRIRFEVVLWKINDIRSYMYSINGMLRLNLCDKQVDLPVHHVKIDADQYFDNYKVEQHMRVIYSDFVSHAAKMNAHMPTIVADRKEIAPLIPRSLRKVLRSS